jgi:hypothetical protein
MTPKSVRRSAAPFAATPVSSSGEATQRRHIFDHHVVDPVLRESAVEVVVRNAKEMALPLGLALAAAVAAWARDPGAREWMAGVWGG